MNFVATIGSTGPRPPLRLIAMSRFDSGRSDCPTVTSALSSREPDPRVGETRRGEQRVGGLRAPRPDAMHAEHAAAERRVRERPAVPAPARVVTVAVERGARERTVGEVEDPDVPPLRPVEVDRDALAVGGEPWMVIVAHLREHRAAGARADRRRRASVPPRPGYATVPFDATENCACPLPVSVTPVASVTGGAVMRSVRDRMAPPGGFRRFWNAGGWMACVLLVMAVQAVTVMLALRFWQRTAVHADPLPEGIS